MTLINLRQFRVSMAAIDPSAEPEVPVEDEKRPPRATLKIVRVPSNMIVDESDEDDEDYDYDELVNGISDDESSEDEETNGGPSSKKSKKEKILEKLQQEASDDDEDMKDDDESGDDDEDEEEAKALLKKLMKGKNKAVEGEDSESGLDTDADGLEMDETVVCTLDPEKVYLARTSGHSSLTICRITNSLWTSWSVKTRKSSSKSAAHTLSI
jgi:FK506-binding nuclear protein